MTTIRLRVAVAAILLQAVWVKAEPAGEQAFWAVWTVHATTTNDHTEVIAACEAFEKVAPDNPFIIVTRQFAAWRLLKLGRYAEAAERLTPMVKKGASGLNKGASDIARAWLTRLDREAVTAALQQVYTRDVAYPETLAGWAALTTDNPPLVDRWGKRWKYRLVGFRHIKGLRDQKYELHSAILGANSDLATALEVPYANRIRLKPIGLKPMHGGATLVEFDTGNNSRPALLSLETRHDRVLFAYMGSHIILLADRHHWKVLPKPR